MKQQFGGDWTEKKLDCIQDYLKAYVKIMSKTKYRFAYIDAFAGTGYREIKDEDTRELLIPELAESETESLRAGSVRRALDVSPHFHQYIFIDYDPEKCKQLNELKTSYADLQNKIKIVNEDANEYLSDLCRYDWTKNRAVLFLDPFGMQVKWETIACIAKTKAIDMWLLFPLGIGVSRLLKKDGRINEAWKHKLDAIFGTNDWFNVFYSLSIEDTFFGPIEKLSKTADFERISSYFIKRLKTVFSKVSEKPAKMVNSKNNPIYLLCFASGNPRGSDTAVKIANDLLKRIQ